MTVPFVDLTAQYESIKPQIDSAIQQVISETAFIGGKYVKQFEEDFAQLCRQHVISCANGTIPLYNNEDVRHRLWREVITVANS